MIRNMQRTAAAILLLPVCALMAQSQTVPAPAVPTGSGYVGSNACQKCHADVWQNFYKNPHYKSLASGREPPERTGCESCHGPAQAHVAAGGGKATIPRAFSLMQPAQAMQACLACHENNFDKANVRRSEHTRNGIACNSCHSIHHPASTKTLLAKKESDLCYGCHADIRAQFDMPSKHRVNEGFMQCSDCHNPHGSFAATWGMGQRSHMVDQALGSESPCVKCHVDKRGPFVYEHPAVRVEGCPICHSPHGSTNAKLLARPVVLTLCLNCHNAGGAGTRNLGVDIETSQHNLLDPKYQKCTVCHVRLHGSNADQFFLR
jgi:DmsE family decaheme c-type cytochrome